MPQENGRAPTSLVELKKLIDSVDDGENGLEFQWLTYTYNMLTSRKAYHKKQQLKKALYMKIAKTLLAKDEQDAINLQAEQQLTEIESTEEVTDDGTEAETI